jgi:predicted anti-sigma-YlaC factor YlaD
VADDPTMGELARSIKRIEDAQLKLAADSVPTSLWSSQHNALIERVNRHEVDAEKSQTRMERDAIERHKTLGREIASLRTLVEREVEDLREEIKSMRQEKARRSEMTWQKWVGLIGALAALALVIVTMVGQAKGIKP